MVIQGGHPWLIPIILAIQEADIRRTAAWANTSQDSISKTYNTKKACQVLELFFSRKLLKYLYLSLDLTDINHTEILQCDSINCMHEKQTLSRKQLQGTKRYNLRKDRTTQMCPSVYLLFSTECSATSHCPHFS
jgi:hypothetical protein